MKTSSLLFPLLALAFFGCHQDQVDKKATQIDYYVDSFENGQGFTPQTKVVYDYLSSGLVNQYTVYSYNTTTKAMVPQRYFTFAYSGTQVSTVKGFLTDATSPYVAYAYEYLPNGNTSKITETNTASGVNSEASFSYTNDDSVTVSFVYSNGEGFAYGFNYANGNVRKDRTTKASQVCSEGEYTYDQHLNPFKNLGYIDYGLTTLSANNRLTEKVNYVGCAFPSLIPESYSYEYNAAGYPTTATTTYKSTSASLKSKREFFYK
jgi:hypothetical protein